MFTKVLNIKISSRCRRVVRASRVRIFLRRINSDIFFGFRHGARVSSRDFILLTYILRIVYARAGDQQIPYTFLFDVFNRLCASIYDIREPVQSVNAVSAEC